MITRQDLMTRQDLDFRALDRPSLTPEQETTLRRDIVRHAREARAARLRQAARAATTWLSGWAARYRRWRERRQDAASLYAMSDRDLRDIGLTRGEIGFVARHDGEDPTRRPRGRRPVPRPVSADRRALRPAEATPPQRPRAFSSLNRCAG